MATGTSPFFRDSVALAVDAILHRSPLPLRQLNPVILPALEVVINKALEKDRRLRYQSAAEMRTDINQLKRDAESVRTTTASSELETNSSGPAASATVAYHLTEPPPVSVRARHLNRAVIAFAALLVFSFAVAGWLYFAHRTRVLRETDTVVLADFANSTGDAVFDATLKQGLAVDLAQSPCLNILSDQRVRDTLKSGRRRRVCTLASVRLSNCTCGFPACSFHEDSRPPRCQKGIKGTFLAPIRLIQSTSLLGRGRTGFSQKELFRPPSSLLIWFPFSS